MGTSGDPIAVAFVEIRPEEGSFEAAADREIQDALSDPVSVPASLEFDQARVDRDMDRIRRALSGQGTLEVESPDVDFSKVIEGAEEATNAVQQLADATSQDFARGFVQGATEAATITGELKVAQDGLAEPLEGNVKLSEALQLGLLGAGRSTDVLARATRVLAAAARDAERREEGLAQSLRRRGAAAGAARVIGVGAAVTVGLLTAREGLRELSEALRVSGNDAATWQGQLRNAGAEILGGNVIGAYKALTNEQFTFNRAQLIAINQTPEFLAQMREMGREVDLAKSAAVELEKLGQVPQFLQTALARETLQGDSAGQLAVLEQQAAALERQIDIARQLGADQTVLNAALEELFGLQTDIKDRSERVAAERTDTILAPFREAVQNATLEGDSAAIVAALQSQRVAIEKAIAAAGDNVDLRIRLRDALLDTNRQIEAVQDQIIAEEERHRQAMIDKRLAPGEEAIIDVQLSGGDLRSALVAQAETINEILAGKNLTRDQRISLKNQLLSINNQIKAIDDEIARQEEQHLRDVQKAREDAHQALIDGIGLDESRLQNRQMAAALTERLGDDIKAAQALVDFYRNLTRNQNLTAAERTQYQRSLLAAQADVRRLRQQERELKKQELREQLSDREELLRDQLELARLDERSTRDDERRLRALIQFLRKQANNEKLSRDERRKYLIEQRRAENELKDLLGEQKQSNRRLQELMFTFMQDQQGFAATLASNLLPSNFSLEQPTSTTERFRPPPIPLPTRTQPVRSPFGATTGATGGAAAALALREQGGKTFSGGQGDELLHIQRETLFVLKQIARGQGFKEADYSKRKEGTALNVAQ